MPVIRSISGLRATLDGSLTEELVKNYAFSFAKIQPEGAIFIGRDGRQSGLWIEEILSDTLVKSGREVRILGMVPTPTVQLSVEHSDAAGGIAITASHNPENWNGLKFIDSTGVFLDGSQNERLWIEVDSYTHMKLVLDSVPINRNKLSEKIFISDAIESHVKSILSLTIFTKTNVLQKIKNKNFHVVVDAVNSSGSIAIPMMLNELNCDVVKLYCDGSGSFPHTPEPLPENLKALATAVNDHKADLGIAVDPDADRLVLIDEKGKPIGEENTIVLAVESVMKFRNLFTQSHEPFIVVNYSTTRRVEDVASKYGAIVERSQVGEINVVKKMKEVNAIIGGEGSGGVILPACHYGRDSLVGTALLLSLLAEENLPLSELTGRLPHYEMLKVKREFSGDLNEILDALRLALRNCHSEIISESIDDGIKFNFSDSWLQLRKSNTEPIIRIIAEAKTADSVKCLIDKAIQAVNI
jgi:phosphomannomutase